LQKSSDIASLPDSDLKQVIITRDLTFEQRKQQKTRREEKEKATEEEGEESTGSSQEK